MKTIIRQTAIFIFTAIIVLPSFGADVDDPVFQAMTDELDRSMNQLAIDEMPSPYFLSYLIKDYEILQVKARYGAIERSKRSNDRYLYIDLRVGEPALDNSNFYATWQDVSNYRENLVEENVYNALRHQIWFYTDEAYKDALVALAGKKAYLQANPSSEQISDFSEVEPVELTGDPVTLKVNEEHFNDLVRTTAGVLKEYPGLQDWKVEYNGRAVSSRFVNSEGSQYLKGSVFHTLEVSATIQADDGQRLTGFVYNLSRRTEDIPSEDEIIADVKQLAEDLSAMAAAETLDEYVGPVLFSDWASGQFFSHLFASQLSLPRKALTADEWMNEYVPMGKLAGKVKRRVFSPIINIADEPSREMWQGRMLAGYKIIDDEGVMCQDITLVEEGRLLTIPMARQPTKKIAESNGHAITLPFQLTVPGISNIFVSTPKPLSEKKLAKKMHSLCRDQDVEFGLVVTLLDESIYSNDYRWTDVEEDKSLLPAPVIVHKVYADDGRLEPVRGLVFDDISIRTLRDIAALGKDNTAHNIMQPTIFAWIHYAASIVTPSILIEEMELKSSPIQEPQPVAGNPIFDK